MNKKIFTISLLFLAHLCAGQQVVGVWDSLRLKAWQEKPCFRDYSFKKDKVPGCAKRTYKFSQKDKELWAPVLEFIELNGEILNDTQTVFKAWDGTLRLFTNKVELDNGQKKLVSINGPAYLAWEIRHHDNPEKFGDPHMCYDCINGRHTQKKVDFPTVKGDLCTPITTKQEQREIAKLVPRDTIIFGKKRTLDSCNVWYVFCDTTLQGEQKVIRCDSVFAKCDTVWQTKEVRISTNSCATCDSVFRVENRGPITEIAWSPNSGAVKNWAGYLVKVGLQIPFHLLTKDSSCLHERLDLTLGMRSVTTQVTDPACGCSQVVQSAPIAWQLEAAYRFFYTPPSSKWRAGIGLGVTGLYRPLNFRTEYDEVKTLGVQAFLEPRLEWRFNKQLAAFVSSRYSFGSNILNENPLSFSLGGRFGIQGRDKRGRKGCNTPREISRSGSNNVRIGVLNRTPIFLLLHFFQKTPYITTMKYIFMDESGDLGFDLSKQGTSRFFSMTFVIVDDLYLFDKSIRKIFANFSKKKIQRLSGVLHCYHLDDNERIKIIQQINHLDFQIYSISLDKTKLHVSLDNHTLYTLITNKLCSYLYQVGTTFQFYASRRYTNSSINKDFITLINNTQHLQKISISTFVSLPQAYKGLQIADFCSWVMFQKLERTNTIFYNMLSSHIKGDYIFQI